MNALQWLAQQEGATDLALLFLIFCAFFAGALVIRALTGGR